MGVDPCVLIRPSPGFSGALFGITASLITYSGKQQVNFTGLRFTATCAGELAQPIQPEIQGRRTTGPAYPETVARAVG